MGRQAHLTRLAMGRSPYGDPLRDENGDFVMSSRAGIHNHKGYKQDFDDRGHPRNNESNLTLRRFWRAQNNVLAAVGVLVREDEAKKSKWELLKVKDKLRLIFEENDQGWWLKYADRLLGAISTWPFVTLRRRIMAFDPYYRTSLVNLVREEWTVFGSGFITAGLPLHLLSLPLQLYRYHMQEPVVEDTATCIESTKYAVGWYEWCNCVLVYVTCYVVELHIQVYAILQGLFIIRPDTLLKLSFFIPFTSASPIFLPPTPTSISITSTTSFVAALTQTPLMLMLIRDHLQMQIRDRLYLIFRQALVRPGHPDMLSATASDARNDIDATSVPGTGCIHTTEDISRLGRYFGPSSFMGAFRVAFPPLYSILNILSRGRLARSRGRLDLESEQLFQWRARQDYYERLVSTTPGSMADVALRREAMYGTFASFNLDPFEELVDPHAWADALVLQDDVYSSNSTPNPQDLFDFADIIQEEARNPVVPSGSVYQDGRQQATDVIMSIEVEPLPQSSHEHIELEVADGSVSDHNSGWELVSNVDQSTTNMRSDLQDGTNMNVIESPLSESPHAIDTPIAPGHDPSDSQSREFNATDGTREPQVGSPNYEHQPQTIAESIDLIDSSSQLLSRPPIPDSQPPTPLQGISRAASLTNPNSTSRPRPLRQPTETNPNPPQHTTEPNETIQTSTSYLDTDDDETSSPILRSYVNHDTTRPHSWAPPTTNAHLLPRYKIDHRQWRVTFLSTFAADSLAWHSSVLITTLILWPLESLYLRSIATWFLNNSVQNGYADHNGILGSPMNTGSVGGGIHVFGLGDWFGGKGSMTGLTKLEYVGSVVVTIGLEAVGRGLLWYLGTRVSLMKGRYYGWGKF